MNLREFDARMQPLLNIPHFESIDPGINGIQVGDLDASVNHVVCAVDACHASIDRATELSADVLFVHHGIYWKSLPPLTGPWYTLIKKLIENKIALYACHLPLDAHPIHGNNACIASQMGLTHTRPFGHYNGEYIGIQGECSPLQSFKEIQESFFPNPLALGDFRNQAISRVGIISGGATRELDQAIAENLDLFITGDANHAMYHTAKAARIDYICGGHYATEIHGVKSIAEYCTNECNISAEFIDIPTGL